MTTPTTQFSKFLKRWKTAPGSVESAEGRLLGVYLVSVSGGHEADLAEADRPNRNVDKTPLYIKIGTFLAFLTR